MEVAGVRPADLSVVFDRGHLIIRGRRYDRAPAEQEEFHVKEIRYGCFERIFRLPDNIESSGIEANYREGFLDIEIPRGKGARASVSITIKEG